jgi:hypothetical protein
MPWLVLRNMNDQDLAAIFAYLKTVKSVHHTVDNSLPRHFVRWTAPCTGEEIRTISDRHADF